jgi:hypothetical protein
MKLLKHMLVVIALFAATLPCIHGEDHSRHLHGTADPAALCGPHDCSCHSCDHAVCPDDPDMLPGLSTSSALAVFPIPPIPLFIVQECRTSGRPLTLRPNGILSSLQTIQLLI